MHRQSGTHPDRHTRRQQGTHKDRHTHRQPGTHPARHTHRQSGTHPGRHTHRQSGTHPYRHTHRQPEIHPDRHTRRQHSYSEHSVQSSDQPNIDHPVRRLSQAQSINPSVRPSLHLALLHVHSNDEPSHRCGGGPRGLLPAAAEAGLLRTVPPWF